MTVDDVCVLSAAYGFPAVALVGVRAIRRAGSSIWNPNFMATAQYMRGCTVVIKLFEGVVWLAEASVDLVVVEASEVLDDSASEGKCALDVALPGNDKVAAGREAMADFTEDFVVRLAMVEFGQDGIYGHLEGSGASQSSSKRFASI